MIPFQIRSDRTLAPADGWASAAPWAAFHQAKHTTETARAETNQSPRQVHDHDGCCAGSWGY